MWHHEGITGVVHNTVNEVSNIGDRRDQRVNQRVLTAKGLYIKTGHRKFAICRYNSDVGVWRGIKNFLCDSSRRPNT